MDSYNDAVWGRIPRAEDAFKDPLENTVPEAVFNDIGTVFVRHQLQDKFGLNLNHRHFDLEPGEKLVEYDRVATPWQIRDTPDIFNNSILGKTWAFVDGTLVPYEFSFENEPKEMDHNPPPPDFEEELRQVLQNHGLASRLGITRLSETPSPVSGPGQYEYTTGRVSVMVPRGQDAQEKVINVAWSFRGTGSDEKGWQVERACARCCRFHG